MKALVDAMAKVRLTFRKHARSVIESSYHLLPDIMDEIDEVAYKREAVRLLLLDDNYLHKDSVRYPLYYSNIFSNCPLGYSSLP